MSVSARGSSREPTRFVSREVGQAASTEAPGQLNGREHLGWAVDHPNPFDRSRDIEAVISGY